MSDIIVVNPPSFPDAQLLFDDEETRHILEFFWPQLAPQIQALEITTERRRIAQQILIAAIDSTYALGFMEKLFQTMFNPRAGIKGLAAMGQKLARAYVKHWWKHASQDKLKRPYIAEAARRQIALNFRAVIDAIILNASAIPPLVPFSVVCMSPPAIVRSTLWG